MRRLSSIMLGFTLASIGVLVAGSNMFVGFCILGISMFSFGEMLCSPKMHEYLGIIAPSDKKALYMGYANIPVGLGWAYGTLAGGKAYEKYGEKANLAIQYMTDKLGLTIDQIPNVMEKGVLIPDRTKAFTYLAEHLNMNATQATTLLWETYSPSKIWIPYFFLGITSALLLAVYNHYAKQWEGHNA
jgi:hypothetical protein